MVEVPRGTPGSRSGELQFVPPDARPHAGQGVNAAGAHAAVAEMGRAYEKMGEVIGQTGSEFAKTAEYLADINNHTKAMDVDFKHMTDTDQMIQDYELNNRGEAAAQHQGEFLDKLNKRRDDAIAAGENPKQKELISEQVTNRTSQLYWRLSQHVAQETLKHQKEVADAHIGSYDSAVKGNPESDEVFQQQADGKAGAVISKMVQEGKVTINTDLYKDLKSMGESEANAVRGAVSAETRPLFDQLIRKEMANLWESRIDALIDDHKPWLADDKYKANKDLPGMFGIDEDRHERIHQKIETAKRSTGAIMIGDGAINGTSLQYQGGNFRNLEKIPASSNQAIAIAMDDVSKETGHKMPITYDQARYIAYVESGGHAFPADEKPSHQGLYQMSFQEWGKWGRGGDTHDPLANARAFFRKIDSEAQEFKGKTGRDANFYDVYMIHNRGMAGYLNSLANPNELEWKVMQASEPGRGEDWAKKTVTQNGGNVNDTAAQFLQRWKAKLNVTGGGTTIDPKLPKLDPDNLDKTQNTLEERLKEADRISDILNPGDEVAKQEAERATESMWHRVARENTAGIQAIKQSLYKAAMERPDVGWADFSRDPANKKLLDDLKNRDPEKASQFQQEMLRKDRAPIRQMTDQERLDMAELSAESRRDPQKFLDHNFATDPRTKNMPQPQFIELLKMQNGMEKTEDKTLNADITARIERDAKVAFEASMGSKITGVDVSPQMIKKWDQFTGQLTDIIAQEQARTGKPVDSPTFNRFARQLLQTMVHHDKEHWHLYDDRVQSHNFEARQRVIERFQQKFPGKYPSENDVKRLMDAEEWTPLEEDTRARAVEEFKKGHKGRMPTEEELRRALGD